MVPQSPRQRTPHSSGLNSEVVLAQPWREKAEHFTQPSNTAFLALLGGRMALWGGTPSSRTVHPEGGGCTLPMGAPNTRHSILNLGVEVRRMAGVLAGMSCSAVKAGALSRIHICVHIVAAARSGMSVRTNTSSGA